MADLEKTVAVIFRGVDEMSGTVKSLSGGLDNFAGKVQNVTGPLADMATKVLQVEAALAALAVGGLTLAVKSAGEFNSQFGEISTLIDIPRDKLDSFRQSIIDYARVSTAAIEDINGSVYTAISAGVDWKDSISEFIPVAEALSTAGLAPLNETTRLLASTMNAYGKETYAASEVSDIFFTTVKLGQTTIPELAASMAQVTSIAAASGVPLETLMSGLAAITAGGADTAMAVTQLKGIITSIIKPTSEAEAAAKELGLEFGATALETQGLEKILWQAYEATGGNTEKMAELFGNVRALGGALTLGADEAGVFVKSLEAMANSSEATATALEKVAFDFNNVNQTLINNLKATLIEVGLPLLDEYRGIAVGIGEVFKGVSVGVDSEAFRPVYDLLESAGVEIAGFMSEIAGLLNDPNFWEGVDFGPLVDSIKSLGESLRGAFVALFGDLDLTTPEGLASAIDKIVAGLTLLTNVTSGIVDAWKPFLSALGSALDAILETDEGTQEFAGNILGLGQAVDKVLDNIGLLTGSLNVIAGALSVLAGKALLGAVGGFQSLAAAVAGIPAVMASAGLSFAAFAANWESLFGGGQGIAETISQIKNEFSVGLTIFANNLKDAANEVLNLDGRSRAWWLSQGYLNDELEVSRLKAAALSNTYKGIPAAVYTKIESETATALVKINEYEKSIGAIPDEKNIIVGADADVNKAKAAADEIIYQFSGKYDAAGNPIMELKIIPGADSAGIADAKKAIDEIPTEKMLEIKLQGEIDKELARIETQAEIIQTAVEWKAKLDIAEAEADAKKFEALAQTISETFVNTGEVLTSLFDVYADSSALEGVQISKWIEEESRRRDEILTLEKELTQAQVDILNARAKALEKGDALIQVTGEGLEPELEAFMWKILQKIQLRVAEDSASFLLGVG